VTTVDFDHVVLGGGLAGLSLAERLVAHGVSGSSIALIEPEQRAFVNRTFCCFLDDEAVAHAWVDRDWITASWSAWSVADDRETVRSHSQALPYVHLDPERIEAALVARLANAGVSVLRSACRTVEPIGLGLRCPLDSGEDVVGRRVHDSRPAGSDQPLPRVVQSFVGRRIDVAEACFDPDEAVLMDFRRSTGTEFLYLLPFSRTSALVEYTRFGPFASAGDRESVEASLRSRLDDYLAASSIGSHEVVREEVGHLPMDARLGQAETGVAGWSRIGTPAGALRPATGYGFLPIRSFADRYAQRLVRDPEAKPPGVFPAWLRWLDGVFLDHLARHPDRGPALFVALSKALRTAEGRADGFARFLSERPRGADLLRVMASLPTLPMVGAACRYTLGVS
jgi:lycopene beta-cyclase